MAAVAPGASASTKRGRREGQGRVTHSVSFVRKTSFPGAPVDFVVNVAGPAAPPPRLRELHEDCALLVTEAWRETVQRYEDEVRELEEALRRGRESRREAEEA